MNSDLHHILEPEALAGRLGDPALRVVDLSREDLHRQLHVPGAVHLDYAALVGVRPPVAGLLPDRGALARNLGALGIGPGVQVVAYDDEGGGKAGRLGWTLDALGFHDWQLLNGGLHTWANEGFPAEQGPPAEPEPAPLAVGADPGVVADRDYIQARLGDPGTVLLDTRGAGEYSGAQRFSARGGHIPGAVHMDWVEAMDPGRNLRLKPRAELEALLAARGVTPDKEVVVYCQTHHRSSHTYVVLKALGYARVRGYPGAWSEWGNLPDTPVE